jgi:hypothetical protein
MSDSARAIDLAVAVLADDDAALFPHRDAARAAEAALHATGRYRRRSGGARRSRSGASLSERMR